MSPSKESESAGLRWTSKSSQPVERYVSLSMFARLAPAQVTPRTGLMKWNTKRMMIIGAVALLAAAPTFPQNPELQQKLAAAKQSVAENKQKLLQYQWTETQQLTLKGDAKPPSKNLCQYGPDGRVQKTAIGPPPQEPSGGRIKQKVIAKKKAEMKDYMQDVKAVLSMYVQPDPQKMQAAYQAGKVSLNPVPVR